MRTETVQVGVDPHSTLYSCPNAGLDPSGVVAGQRWRYEGRPGEWLVVSEPNAAGDVRLVPLDAGRVTTVGVGHLLAYWTCLDVPG